MHQWKMSKIALTVTWSKANYLLVNTSIHHFLECLASDNSNVLLFADAKK